MCVCVCVCVNIYTKNDEWIIIFHISCCNDLNELHTTKGYARYRGRHCVRGHLQGGGL